MPLFSALSASALGELARSTRRVVKDAIVISEGDAAHSFFIVCSGSLKVCSNDEQRREVVLTTLCAGDHFGELALLDNAPRSASRW